MGMAASQVRFLSLQHRKNSIGRQLATLSNRKMSLSRDMNDVSRHYTNALNQINLKWSNDCGATYHGLTYDMLMKPNDVNTETPYILTNARNGKVIVNDSAILDKEGNPIEIRGLKIGNDPIPDGHLSYLTLAKIISAFSHVREEDKALMCVDGRYAQDENGNWVGQANPGGYYIPGNDDFSFENNLRMNIFMMMGLVTQDQIDTQNSMLTELYGSQEAKETGIYPVGTAWGDYYIALANLEAYDAYVGSDQTLSNAGTYEGTDKTQKEYAETIGDYHYSTKVNGISGDSTCTQTTTNTGAAGHVDFTAGVLKDADGNYQRYDSTDTTGVWHSAEMDALFNDEKYDAKINGADTTWGAYFKHTVDKGVGLKYEYHYNDVLANALENYKTLNGNIVLKDAQNQDFDLEKALYATDNQMTSGRSENLRQRSFILSYRERRRYSETYQGVKNGLNSLCDTFSNILLANTLVEIDTDALAKAKKSTVDLFYNNMTKFDGGECTDDVDNQATKDCIDKLGVSIVKQGWHFDGILPHLRRRACAAVDVKTLFNTFMTYYNHYSRSNDSGSNGSTVEVENIPQFNIAEDYTGEDETCVLKTIGGKKYLEQTMILGYDANGKTITDVTRTLLTTDSGQAEDSEEFIQFSGSTMLTEEDEFATKYYIARDESLNYSVQYYTNKSNNNTTFTYTDPATNNQVTKNVYATISTEDKIYYCETQAQLNYFLTNNTVQDGTPFVEYVKPQPDSFPIELLPGDKTDKYQDHVSLNPKSNNCDFDIRLETKIVNDPAYRKHLEDAVRAAEERITKLEEDIEDFYSSSDKKIMDYYDAMFLRIAEQGWEEDEHTKNDVYLNNKIQNNDFFLTECLQKNSSTGFRYTAKQATNISKIFSVHDTNAEHEALVKYESEKNRLQYKENAIDTRMRLLETEQEAINTEMESVQKVCNDNISKYFKIFA